MKLKRMFAGWWKGNGREMERAGRRGVGVAVNGAVDGEGGSGGEVVDQYAGVDPEVVPSGVHAGESWDAVPARTLHSILSAVERGDMVLAPARVRAVRMALDRR